MTLILDVGSGNSLPDMDTVHELLAAIKEVDSGKHTIILKAQIFEDVPPNKPILKCVFSQLHKYGNENRYKVTASVFDIPSLKYLLDYDIPFVKIACRTDLYWLIGEVPRKIPVYVSIADERGYGAIQGYSNTTWLFCVPKYPALLFDYEAVPSWAPGFPLSHAWISDHTEGWALYHKYHPEVLEKHIVLERSPDNPDSGPFAITPSDLKEIM